MKTKNAALKNVPIAILSGALLAGFSANAGIYRDIDVIWKDSSHTQVGVVLSATGVTTASGMFDIVTGDGESVNIKNPYYFIDVPFQDQAGFNPATEDIIDAVVWFYFRDHNKDTAIERVRIDLDGFDLTSTLATDQLNNKSFSIFGGDASGTISALQADGQLQYVITAQAGDFTLTTLCWTSNRSRKGEQRQCFSVSECWVWAHWDAPGG